MGQVACGLFGVWALIKRRKCRGEEFMRMLPKVRKEEKVKIEINLGAQHAIDLT